MSTLNPERLRFRWARVRPELPPGIHEPKHKGDCGWDLSAMEDVIIRPTTTVDVPINCRLELPSGYWAEMKPRSSIAKRGLQLDAGIIDEGYRGPLYVICRNTHLPEDPHMRRVDINTIEIKAGERIGQLIFHRLHELWSEEVDWIDVSATSRGEAAFGSTGQ